MDAAKFIKESVRMCSSHNCCDGCPAEDIWCIADEASLAEDDAALKNYIAIVEKWSNEHPPKTNIMKFEEIFGKEAASFVKGYASGNADGKVFRGSLACWLGEEYEERKEK